MGLSVVGLLLSVSSEKIAFYISLSYLIGVYFYFAHWFTKISKVNTKICKNCDELNQYDSEYCRICGAKLKEIRRCDNCGKLMPEDSNYCDYCGESLFPNTVKIEEKF
ncbi:MAG: zinc ribbon domain-containing protein [Thermoplasmatota archaeon]